MGSLNKLQMFSVFLIVRLASVYFVQTWYVPDEYWQSMEVAHNIAFGYGYLTWEWLLGLRSYLHPLLIAGFYKILSFLNADTDFLVIYGPRVGQAILSAYADLCFYKWSGNHKWAAFSIATSWFWFYNGSRTLINSVETALTIIALYMFPWKTNTQFKDKNCFLWVIAILCAIRPTAAILWLPLCFYDILSSQDSLLNILFKKYLPIGLIVLSVSTALDSFAHGELVITPWEFLKANVFNNVGSWYGTLPWHWYLSQGLPGMMGIYKLPFLAGSVQILRNRYAYPDSLVLLGCVVWTVAVYSCLPHKEFRFLLPILPIMLFISSDYLSRWSRKASNQMVWLVAGVLLFANVVPAYYMGMIHQRGSLDVMSELRSITSAKGEKTSLLFLMPCHSTPYYSHLHVNVTARFLTCEPNLKNATNYEDEAEIFYRNPNKWLRTQYPPNGTLPSYIISFDALVPQISDILSRYKPTHRVFHTSFPISSFIGRYIVINELIETM